MGFRFLAAAASLAIAGAGAANDTNVGAREGLNFNSFVRQGPVAAHIVLRSGTDPRLIVAFPAGNSGVGLWFDPVPAPATWRMTAPAQPVTLPDAKGRPLYGIVFTASIDAARLRVKQAVLSSIRVLRDYQAIGTAPAAVLTPARLGNDTLGWARDRLDGAPGYRLTIRPVRGRLVSDGLEAGADGVLTIEVTALTGETPLTPAQPGAVLNERAAADPAARRALEFLSYREKYLAGSWRFETYFGRDTLMSVRLLMPALRPEAVETGVRSVLERLSPEGRVAHEEDIGEFAVLDHRKEGVASDAPVYNYNMIDSDFMLAPVARAWLLDDPRGRPRAAAFLAERAGSARLGDLLVRNLRFATQRARAFADRPVAGNLVGLKPGMQAGEWRDSNDGLGGGRYPFDVNAVLVPAALEAAADFDRSGLLAPYLTAEDRVAFADLPRMLAVWRDRAAPLFEVSVPAAQARAQVSAYAARAGVPDAPALAAIGDAPVRFRAIALDAEGRPVTVLNSDVGFALLFARPTPDQLRVAAATIARPFPAGLMTGAGLLVADPAFAPAAVQARFGPNAYHGTVVWSWQQALAAAGLQRQLARADLPVGVRSDLEAAQACLWRAIDATRAVQSSELWSWRYADGRYRITPFGANGADVDESNAAQLWSTVYLALARPPAGSAAHCPAG